MKFRDILIAAGLAAVCASPIALSAAYARDTSFTFHGTYQGRDVTVLTMAHKDCATLIGAAKGVFYVSPTEIVPMSDIEGRRCNSDGPSEAPDTVLHFVGLGQPVKVYYRNGGEDLDRRGGGPRVPVSIGAQQWTWDDGEASYYMVDNLSITDKKTGTTTCYQELQKRFSCKVNP